MICFHAATSALFAFILVPAFFLPSFQARAGEEKWRVPFAEVRFKMEITEKPSVPEAGIVAIIQNGGLLPHPEADSIVFDSAGNELKSECIWNNPREGIGIVFDPPAVNGPVSIYFKGAPSVRAWTPQSAFRPSLLLYTETGKRSLADAKNMSASLPPAPTGRMGLVPMVADRTNRFGPSENYVSYYCGWLNVPEDNPIFYGTISSDGSEALLDGKVVADWPGEHPYHAGVQGQHGTSVALGKGPHRFEYLHFSVSRDPQAQFIWRLSGKDKGQAATPRNADFVRSGSGKIIAAETKSGAPLAMFEKTALRYAGYDDVWIDLFELTVPLAGKNSETGATWEFGDNHTAQGTKVLWPVVRGNPPVARLSVKGISGTTSSTRSLYFDELPKGTSITNPRDRALWQEGLLNLAKGSPHRDHVAADWPKCFWTMLPEIIEPGEAAELLGELFDHSYEELQNLPQEAREKLENIYLQDIVSDEEKAPAFLTKAISNQRDPERRVHWQMKEIDYYLFEVGDLKTARRLSEQLRGAAIGASAADAALLLVQCGDIERLEGDLDKAQQFYTKAQQDYRRTTATVAAKPLGSILDRPLPVQKPKSGTPAAAGMVIGAAQGTQTDWRVRTVRQNAFFSQVTSLLDQKYIPEARKALDEWILEFPFSKLGGDYTLAEARYYSLCGNNARAVRILKAYRKQTEISNELPPAMELELRCLVALGDRDALEELAADIKKRFPDLPLAKDAELALEDKALPKQKVIRHKVVNH
jgi:TolA-binding protein